MEWLGGFALRQIKINAELRELFGSEPVSLVIKKKTRVRWLELM